VRDATRRLRSGLWVAVGVGIAASLSLTVIVPELSSPARGQGQSEAATAAGRGAGARIAGDESAAARAAAVERRYAAVLNSIGTRPAAGRSNAVAAATAAREAAGQTEVAAAQQAGVFLPGRGGSSSSAVQVASLAANSAAARIRPLGTLRQPDLLVVAPTALPAAAISAIRRLPGVTAANLLGAARIKVNGGYVAILGVNPSTFREFAAKPTAKSTMLWQNVAAGGIAVSYLMGQQEKIPLGGTVQVDGARTEQIPVAGFGTVGISGVDAVVSDSVARSLGMPAGNAIVISAPHARLSTLMRKIARLLPTTASVAPLVGQAAIHGLPGSAGAVEVTASDGPGLTVAQTRAFLTAALAQVGKRYVWGGDGPNVFDCSGLVQWSMRQAGITMPRVAVNQAQTGPQVPLSALVPGDLLFYHTDPTAPTYISHVAIYLGKGLMLQAPEPGEDVQIVPAIFTGGFAGAVAVYPRLAAAVAADLAG
jgi:peptidoglycan DL-endopeptidase CwlO